MVAGALKSIHIPQYRRMLTKLRQSRQAAGLTQAAVGERFMRPQSFVSKCESGERRIDPTELQEFARLYRKPVAFFLDSGDCGGQVIGSLLAQRAMDRQEGGLERNARGAAPESAGAVPRAESPKW
jgi:transcriptional regulator with XRE-family HTH domain